MNTQVNIVVPSSGGVDPSTGFNFFVDVPNSPLADFSA